MVEPCCPSHRATLLVQIAIFLAFVFLGCGRSATHFSHLLTASNQIESSTGIKITYLGTSGFLIERGSDAILIAPFFSHQKYLPLGFWRTFWKIGSQKDVVQTYMDPLKDSLKNVEAVLVGHGHYDHLLDVPYIMQHYKQDFHPNVKVYGSETVCNILNAAERVGCQPIAKGAVEREDSYGKWWFNEKKTIRFIAIESEHAPNCCGITIAKGDIARPLARLPQKAGGWKKGETLAYMIDFMGPGEEDSVVFRIYFQDAAHSPPDFHTLRHNPEAWERQVDLAIVCVAAFHEVPLDSYPETVEAVIQPKQYLLSHWENFFRDYTRDLEKLRSVPMTDPEKFVKRLEGINPKAGWVMPMPGNVVTY